MSTRLPYVGEHIASVSLSDNIPPWSHHILTTWQRAFWSQYNAEILAKEREWIMLRYVSRVKLSQKPRSSRSIMGLYVEIIGTKHYLNRWPCFVAYNTNFTCRLLIFQAICKIMNSTHITVPENMIYSPGRGFGYLHDQKCYVPMLIWL